MEVSGCRFYRLMLCFVSVLLPLICVLSSSRMFFAGVEGSPLYRQLQPGRPGQQAWVNKPFNQWTPADHIEHASHVGQCSWYVVSLTGTSVWSFASSAAAALRPPLYVLPCGAFAPPTVRLDGPILNGGVLRGFGYPVVPGLVQISQ